MKMILIICCISVNESKNPIGNEIFFMNKIDNG